jgi:hypothetical protein
MKRYRSTTKNPKQRSKPKTGKRSNQLITSSIGNCKQAGEQQRAKPFFVQHQREERAETEAMIQNCRFLPEIKGERQKREPIKFRGLNQGCQTRSAAS